MRIDKLTIRMTEPGRGMVYIDDEPVERVVAVSFKAGVERSTEVTLVLHVPIIDVEAHDTVINTVERIDGESTEP